MKFKDYVYLMLGFQKKTTKVRRIVVIPNKKTDISTNESLTTGSTIEHNGSMRGINKIVITITRFMAVASLLLILALIVFGFINKEAPSILSQILMLMVGYLGGVLASYARFIAPDKK